MIMSISGFVDTIPVSTLQSVSIIESEFVQAALTGRILCYGVPSGLRPHQEK